MGFTNAELEARDRVVFVQEFTPSELAAHRRRLVGIAEWLDERFPCARPSWRLIHGRGRQFLDEDTGRPLYGWTSIDESGRIVIGVHAGMVLTEKVMTLLHEWAHAHTWRQNRIERQRRSSHDDDFYLALGRIERAWGDR